MYNSDAGESPKTRIKILEQGESLKSSITKNFLMYEQHEQFVVL
jgi:hypothetical protein